MTNDERMKRANAAFTVLELLVVIAIIIVLAGLILATTGYVQKKAARSRAESEIAGISAACESYKADNGNFPSTSNTVSLNATMTDPSQPQYWAASMDLFAAIAAQNNDGSQISGQKSYMAFKPASMGRSDMSAPVSAGNPIRFLRDPFGNSYGYSTSKNPDANPNAAGASGYNPTFDLWSTGGTLPNNADTSQWLKNW